MSARTGLRVGCFTAAAAVVAWSLLVSGAPAAAPVPVPANVLFASVATATGVLQHTDATMGLSATSEPVYGSLPDAYSTFSSGSGSGTSTGRARASTYYPGATVLGLGGLIATAGGPSGVIPSYPFTAIADNNTPNNSIASPAPMGGSGQPASAESSTAVAHVAPDLVTADAVVSSFNAPGIAPNNGQPASGAVVHIGSIQAHTRHAFDDSGLVTHADSLVSDVDIAGGLHIGSVATTSTITVSPGAKPKRDDQVTISGATFMGTPVTIGANGVAVNGSGQGKAALDLANATMGQSLRAAGLSLHLIGVNSPPAAINPSCTAGEADGLDIHAQVDASGVPVAGNIYYTDIVLGAACTTATAAASDAGSAPSADVPSSGSGGGAGGAPAVVPAAPAGPLATSGAGSTPSAPAPGQSAPAGSTSPPLGGRRQGRTAEGGSLGADLTNATVAQRLRALYLALGLIALGLVAGAKSLVPSRLPGTR